jgi:hypothetical protein
MQASTDRAAVYAVTPGAPRHAHRLIERLGRDCISIGGLIGVWHHQSQEKRRPEN